MKISPVSKLWVALMLCICEITLISIAPAGALSGNVDGIVKVPKYASGIVVDPESSTVFITSSDTDKVYLIDENTKAIRSSISLAFGSYPTGIALNAVTHRLYVANFHAATISVIDEVSLKIISNISVGQYPYHIVINEKLNKIYVANSGTGTISVINGITNSLITNIGVGLWMQGLGFDSKSGNIYVAMPIVSTNYLEIISSITDKLIGKIPLPFSPGNLVSNPNTGKLYVTSPSSGDVFVIDESSSQVIKAISIGNMPYSLAINLTSGNVYVANNSSNMISVISEDSNSIIGTLSIGGTSGLVAVDQANGNIYFANFDTVYALMPSSWRPESPSSPSVLGIEGGSWGLFSWSAPPGNDSPTISGYIVQTSPDAITWSAQDLVSTTSVRVSLGFYPRIFFRVSAVNSVGQGPFSESVSLARTSPMKVTSIFATLSGDGTTASIDWSPPTSDGGAAISGFVLETSTDRIAWSPPISVDGHSYLEELRDIPRVFFKVAAVNEIGTGEYSEPVVAFRSVPDAIEVPTHSLSSDGRSVRFFWPAPSNGGSTVSKYYFESSNDDVHWSREVTLNRYGSIALGNGPRLYVRVAAVNQLGVGPYSTSTQVAGLVRQASLILKPSATSLPANKSVKLSSLGGSGVMNISYETTENGCLILSDILKTSQAGICTIVAVNPASGIFDVQSSSRVTVNFTAIQQQPLNVNPGKNFTSHVVHYSLSSSGGSGSGAVRYEVSGRGCSVQGSMLFATVSTTCGVVALKDGSGIYAPKGSPVRAVTFSLKGQAPLSLTSQVVGGAYSPQQARLTALGGSGSGALSYLVTGNACTASGRVITVSQTSRCTVRALRAASGAYAQQVSAPVTFVLAAYQQPPNEYMPGVPDYFPSSDWGNVYDIGDCTFASAAAWEELILGIHPSDATIGYEFGNAGGSASQGLTLGKFFSYWINQGIDGVRIKGYDALTPTPQNLRGSVFNKRAVLATLDFRAGSTLDGYRMQPGGHMLLVDGYNATGPVVVTWGLNLQMSWQEWNSEATGIWVIKR